MLLNLFDIYRLLRRIFASFRVCKCILVLSKYNIIKWQLTIILFWFVRDSKKDISCYQNYSLRNKGVCPVATYYLAPFSFSFQHVWLLLTDYWPRIDIEEQQEWWKFAHSFVLTMNREMSLLPVNDDRFHFFTRKVQNFWVYIRQSTIIINFPISLSWVIW